MAKKALGNIPFIFFALVGIPILVVLIAFSKNFFTEPSYIYAKVKVSQGLWWVSSAKPSLWMAQAINVGDAEKNLLGQKTAEVLEIKYYPFFARNTYEDDYDIYLTLKLATNSTYGSQKALFKRSILAVGAPIELEFPSVQISGTVMELANQPFADTYTEKTVFLTKRWAYPWEYDAIKIGESYFDGNDKVFEIIDKRQSQTATISADSFGNLTAGTLDATRYITVVAKIKALVKDGELYFGEEKLIKAGSLFTVTTPSYTFEDFVISRFQ